VTALFNTPFGAFALQRYPARRGERLLPWCGADSLLLEAMHSLQLPAAQTLVVNDEHGALSVPLQPAGLWTDSMLAKIALERNLRANKLGPVTVTWSTRSPPGEPACAVLRVPKQLPYFQFQLGEGAAPGRDTAGRGHGQAPVPAHGRTAGTIYRSHRAAPGPAQGPPVRVSQPRQRRPGYSRYL
jgi:hypothetical protein